MLRPVVVLHVHENPGGPATWVLPVEKSPTTTVSFVANQFVFKSSQAVWCPCSFWQRKPADETARVCSGNECNKKFYRKVAKSKAIRHKQSTNDARTFMHPMSENNCRLNCKINQRCFRRMFETMVASIFGRHDYRFSQGLTVIVRGDRAWLGLGHRALLYECLMHVCSGGDVGNRTSAPRSRRSLRISDTGLSKYFFISRQLAHPHFH